MTQSASLNSTVPASVSNYGNQISSMANQFAIETRQVLAAIDHAAVGILDVAWVTVLIVGLGLYVTRLNKHLGKDLIAGGIFLAILNNFVFPSLIAQGLTLIRW